MVSKNIDIMVQITNPSGMDEWSDKKKLKRLERVIEWHKYIQRLNPVKVPFVWGTHQILSQTRLCCVSDMYVVVYRVKDLFEFDKLMAMDPLRDCSKYSTIMLTPLGDDRKNDSDRVADAKNSLLKNKPKAARDEFEKIRSMFKDAPDYVGKYTYREAPNPTIFYMDSQDEAASENVQILIYGMNPPEYHDWSDARKLVHYEKVTWWHDHMAHMIEKNIVTHAWGTRDFCDIEELSYRSAGGAAVYSVGSLDEFDEIYKLDPLRESGRFQSMILKPIESQKKIDDFRYKKLRKRIMK